MMEEKMDFLKKFLWASAITIGLAVAFVALEVYAARADVYYDFGTIGADGGAVCASDCVLAAGSHSFDGGLGPVIATGLDGSGNPAFVTQKPGAFGTETGIGASLTYPSPSPSTNYEIAPPDSLLTDWTGVAGNLTSVFIGSLQGPDTANIYAGATLGTMSLIGVATGTMDPQQFAVPLGTEFVSVKGIVTTGDPNTEDTVLIGGTIDTSVPEPSTVVLLGVGLLGLGLLFRRRSGTAQA
jgi:PEP-CTERM motif